MTLGLCEVICIGTIMLCASAGCRYAGTRCTVSDAEVTLVVRRKPALLRCGEPATEQGRNDNRQVARGWRWEPWWLDGGSMPAMRKSQLVGGP